MSHFKAWQRGRWVVYERLDSGAILEVASYRWRLLADIHVSFVSTCS